MLRIGFDLDGVLADMDGELARHAERLFGESAVPAGNVPAIDSGQTEDGDRGEAASETDGAPSSLSSLTPRQLDRLWDHVESIEDFWETLAEIEPGAVERLATLAAERRWEIIFLTKRPPSAGVTAQVQTQRWLAAKGFALPSVFVVQGSRGRIASALALDAVVDDRPENCIDVVVDSKARAVLVWRSDDRQLPAAAQRLGMRVVKSVNESIDVLLEMDSTRESPGLVARVKRALGLEKTV